MPGNAARQDNVRKNFLKAPTLLLFLLVGLPAVAFDRSRPARAAFQRSHPCPATNQPRGACPGYVVDHVVPLCAGGADEPGNMQWQTAAEAKAKDREERKLCKMSFNAN